MAEGSDLAGIYQKEKRKLNKLLYEYYQVVSIDQLGSDKTKIFQEMQKHTAIRQLAEVESIKGYEDHVLPSDKKTLLALAFKEARNEVEVSKETLECVRRKLHELQELKTNNEKYLKEEKHLLNILKQKGEEDGIVDKETGAILDQTIASEPMERKTEAQMKFQAMKKLKNKRMTQLNDVLLKYFPPPSMEQIEKERDLFRFDDLPPMKSLAAILEMLVVEFLSNSRQCWISITPDMWLQHVELLLRSGIAVRNPSNSSQIRLQKFVE